jgi:subtilisin family serine protease
MHHVKLSQGMSMEEALEEYQDDPDVEYAEPNYVRRISRTPDDWDSGELWGLEKIAAPGAWDIQTGSSSVVVAVLDTGVDWHHEDLTGNIWRNLGEDWVAGSPGNNQVDDDGNGKIDDYYGWDFVNNDNDPYDDNDHGTHVSGTIGAEGDNGTGITGVNWSVSIMPLKMLNANGTGSVAAEIEAIDYAIDKEAKIINASFTGPSYSVLEYERIERARDAGILFVAAAGNGNPGTDNDSSPKYPASYDLDNVIAVAATDHNDALASFSNYGATSVDVAAPGTNIYSTKPGNDYQHMAGTSMATPHVSGLAALIWAEDGSLLHSEVKDRILNGVDVMPALTGQVLMAGRTNANDSIDFTEIIPHFEPSGLWVWTLSSSQIGLSWTDNSDDESGFKIERKIGSAGNYSHITTVQADGESYTDTGLNDGTDYYYRVCAFNAAGNSDYSDEETGTTPLSAPTGLSADAQSNSQIDLRWTDNSAVESGYKIEEKAGAGGTFREIAEVGPNVQRYSRTGLSASTTYTYRVRAFKGNELSDYSNQATDGTIAASANNGESSSGGSGGGGGGGGCFIQTAASR